MRKVFSLQILRSAQTITRSIDLCQLSGNRAGTQQGTIPLVDASGKPSAQSSTGDRPLCYRFYQKTSTRGTWLVESFRGWHWPGLKNRLHTGDIWEANRGFSGSRHPDYTWKPHFHRLKFYVKTQKGLFFNPRVKSGDSCKEMHIRGLLGLSFSYWFSIFYMI